MRLAWQDPSHKSKIIAEEIAQVIEFEHPTQSICRLHSSSFSSP